jgi:hypothetical protein
MGIENDRAEALLAPANAALAKLGVERIGSTIDPFDDMSAKATLAAFNPTFWMMFFSHDILRQDVDDREFARRAATTYHECRHAEQTFRVARKMAADRKSAAEIAKAISIPGKIAAMATPLGQDRKDEWAEAQAWQYTMEAKQGMPSPAELVNTQQEAAMARYEQARRKLREHQRAMTSGRSQQLSTADRESLERVEAGLQREYTVARELAKQCYLQYAKMPVEQDAWATGGLIETALGLPPSTPEQQLDNLDKDERTMVPIQMVSPDWSEKEKALIAAMQKL